MKCEKFLLDLDRFVDGDLEESLSEAMQNHRDGCSACAKEHDFALALQVRISSMPRAVEPTRDLWPEIAGTIQREKVVPVHFGRVALVAAAAVVLLVGSVVTAFYMGRQQGVSSVDMVVSGEAAPSAVLLASFNELGVRDFEVTRAGLLSAVKARRSELSFETYEVVMTNLRLIDDAMGRIAMALDDNPDSELLQKQLAAAYRSQIGLLERALRLPAEV